MRGKVLRRVAVTLRIFLFGGRSRFRTWDPSSVNAVLYP